MIRSSKFWLGAMLANMVVSWLLEIPIWALPAVTALYILVVLGIEKWQRS